MITINKPHSRDDCRCWQCRVSQTAPIAIGFATGATGGTLAAQPVWLVVVVAIAEVLLLTRVFAFICNTTDFRLWWLLWRPEWIDRWAARRRR